MSDVPMEGVTVKELWMLLGEKDVQIYQLLKHIEDLNDRIAGFLEPKREDNGGLEQPTSEHGLRDIPE
jgi:hypothetical protein